MENPDEEPDVESAAVEFTEELPPLHVVPTSFDACVAGIEPCSVIRELSEHHAGDAGVKVEQAELRGEVKTHEDEGRVLGHTPEWVFPSPTNGRKPLAQPTANLSLTGACGRAEIEAAGFHALRHTFGTRLAEAGVRLEVIKELMGHSKVATTLIYVHPSHQAAREAVERVLVTNWSLGVGRTIAGKAG